MTEVLAITKDGRKLRFYNPIYLRLIKSFDCPASSLRVKVLSEKEPPYLREIHIRRQGKIVFRGFLDRQIFEKSKEGGFLSIEARSMGCLLTDNEAVPGAYYNASLGSIFDKYIGSFGVFENCLDKNARSYETIITKGKSRWEAFSHFCSLTLGKTPYIRFDNRVVTGSFEKNISLDDAYSVRKIYNPSKIISVAVLRDENGAYRKVFRSPFKRSKGILRVRYFPGTKDWESKKRESALEIFKKSLAKSEVTEVFLGETKDIEIGDTVFFGGERLCVREIDIKLSPKKEEEKLSLCPVEDF